MWEPAPPPAPLSEVAEISSLFWLCTQINKTCTARGTQIPPPGKGVQQAYALIRKEEKMEQRLQWGREGFLGRAWKKKKKKRLITKFAVKLQLHDIFVQTLLNILQTSLWEARETQPTGKICRVGTSLLLDLLWGKSGSPGLPETIFMFSFTFRPQLLRP